MSNLCSPKGTYLFWLKRGDTCNNFIVGTLRETNLEGVDPFLLAVINRSESMVQALKNVVNTDHCDAKGRPHRR